MRVICTASVVSCVIIERPCLTAHETLPYTSAQWKMCARSSEGVCDMRKVLAISLLLVITASLAAACSADEPEAPGRTGSACACRTGSSARRARARRTGRTGRACARGTGSGARAGGYRRTGASRARRTGASGAPAGGDGRFNRTPVWWDDDHCPALLAGRH